nr:uncharacterized protein LOC110282624 isoform X2 [Parasteatoda tepidariorum]
MESEDPKVTEFLEIVFHDMRQTAAGAVNLSSSLRARARPYTKFKKQLNVMYRALDPMHRSGFETLFLFLHLNKTNAFNVMSSHCLAVWEQCTEGIDVFLHLMYTCSFTYSLLAFCESNGEPNLLCLFSKWIKEMYSDLIKPKFEDADGWEGLDFFCSTSNLHFILDFINLCYNKQGKLFTHIVLGDRYYFFGLNHDDIISSLRKNFGDFKNAVLAEYESELNGNFKYKFAVMLAFIKIELAFDHTASVFNPPSPRNRLLYPTPVLFKYYMWNSLKNNMPDNIRRAFVEQEEQARINKVQAYLNQEQSRANQVQAYLNQEQPLADQEEILTNQDRANQKQTHCEVENDYFDSEHTPDIDFLITVFRDYIDITDQTPPIEKHFPADVASPGIKEQASDIVEQAPNNEDSDIGKQGSGIQKQDSDIEEKPFDNEKKSPLIKERAPDINQRGLKTIEEISATVKQYFANAKQFNTIEKAFAFAEQYYAAMKLAPGTKNAPNNANDSQIQNRTSRRLIFVKYDPEDSESYSDSE